MNHETPGWGSSLAAAVAITRCHVCGDRLCDQSRGSIALRAGESADPRPHLPDATVDAIAIYLLGNHLASSAEDHYFSTIWKCNALCKT